MPVPGPTFRRRGASAGLKEEGEGGVKALHPPFLTPVGVAVVVGFFVKMKALLATSRNAAFFERSDLGPLFDLCSGIMTQLILSCFG